MTGASSIPVLRGAAVTLRPHTMSDVDAVYDRCVDPVTRQFTTIPLEYTPAMAAQYVSGLLEASADVTSWAIDVDGRYAGTIDLRTLLVDAGAGSLGFVTHPAFRGRGVMSEAVRLIVGHTFDTLGWQLLRWQAHAYNWGSAKAVWRNGFPVPTFVPRLLVERGRAIDAWMSTLGRDDPREPVAPWDDVAATLAATR